MSRYLKAIIVMRSGEDIRCDQYVCDDGERRFFIGDEHVATTTFEHVHIDMVFATVAKWFRDRTEKIERERLEEEQARLREIDIDAGMRMLIVAEATDDPHGENLMGPLTPSDLAILLVDLLRKAAQERSELPQMTRSRLDEIAATIGAQSRPSEGAAK